MKIAIIPLDIKLGNPHENLIATAERLRYVDEDTDIVLLPETFTTGFLPSKERMTELAETVDGHTIDDIKRWASFFKVAIAGSFICKTEDGIFNRAFFIEPCGDETYYDKRHLFFSGEHKTIDSGAKLPPIIRYMGWNFSLGICYDLRFPGWLRNRPPYYDVLLIPANWPEKRRYAWNTLLSARAIENLAYVAGANRSGIDELTGEEYLSESSNIYDYKGFPVGQMNEHGIIHAVLRKDGIDKIRQILPALNEQDPFVLDQSNR